MPLRTWILIGVELGLVPRFEFGLDPRAIPADAGHLAIQELILRLAKSIGASATFELPIRPAEPSHAVDVFIRDNDRRRLLVVEAWNRLDDIGRGVRSFDRKLAAANEVAIAIGSGRPFGVFGVWILRETRHHRHLVATYPEVFASRFAGSSRAWVQAITSGTRPPQEPGLVWSSLDATRIFAWRRDRA